MVKNVQNSYETWPTNYKDLFAECVSEYMYDFYKIQIDLQEFAGNYDNILNYFENKLHLNPSDKLILIEAVNNICCGIADTLLDDKGEYLVNSIRKTNKKMNFLKLSCDIHPSRHAGYIYLFSYDNEQFNTIEELCVHILNDKYGYTKHKQDITDIIYEILTKLAADIETYYEWENNIRDVIIISK